MIRTIEVYPGVYAQGVLVSRRGQWATVADGAMRWSGRLIKARRR